MQMNNKAKTSETNKTPDFDFDDFLVKKCKWHLGMKEEEKKKDPHIHME